MRFILSSLLGVGCLLSLIGCSQSDDRPQLNIEPRFLQFSEEGRRETLVLCTLEDSFGDPIPLAGCQFKAYNSDHFWDFNLGAASPRTTEGKFLGSYHGNGLKQGECGIAIANYSTYGGFILGCRVQPASGGAWLYEKMMILLSAWAPQQFNLDPPGVTLALPGSDVTFNGKAEKLIDGCEFFLPPANNIVTLDFELGSALTNYSLGHYHGAGLEQQECGVTLLKVTPALSGFVRASVHSNAGFFASSTFVELIVASSPEAPLLTVFAKPRINPGDVVQATCVVKNSRPVANITWYLENKVVRNDSINEAPLDSMWRWNHDSQTIVQHLKYVVNTTDDKKRLYCASSHVALTSGRQYSRYYQIRVNRRSDHTCGNWKPNLHLQTGGQDATRGQFPWHAALYGRQDNGFFLYFCGGTLIKPNIVVTAAHCVYIERLSAVQNASEVRVGLGKLDRDYNGDPVNNGVQTSDVDSIVVYRHYRGSRTNTVFDIALLKLTSPVKMTDTVGLACVEWEAPLDEDEEELMTGVKGTVSGWGVNTAYTAGARTLQWINLPWIGRNSCIQQTEYNLQNLITHDKFCAGFVNKTKSVCRGDSGGGYMVLKNGQYYLRGVVSTALSYRTPDDDVVCSADHYTSFTSLSRYTSWLKRNILRMM